MHRFQKVIFYLFAILLFFAPLVLWPFTSEVFEFNKMILVYILTTLIVPAWIARMIFEKKIIFRRTILDIPLLVFIVSQLISTLLSIDPLTSWFGYYSRFNGGFFSVICYSLLYWAFVSNISGNEAKKLIKILLAGAVIVSLYGILEHFGIDKDLWVQDVQRRVFSTLGQPNWLAAWLVAILPLTWAPIKSGVKNKNSWIYFCLSILFFWVLIFTKSRSGLLGFSVTFLVFWFFYFWSNRGGYRKHLIPFGVFGLSLLVISLISGTPWTPSIYSLTKPESQQIERSQGPALETGGTESGTIRKIVWKGALQIFLHYPIFGTGPETFAYSYYKYRPPEHNLVSEWDFIYNKAHNEYLNFMANSGTVGILSYLTMIGFSIYVFMKKKRYELLAGYLSLLVTNFFGFSVVPTQLELFLFPAIALTNSQQTTNNKQQKNLENLQKFALLAVGSLTLYVVFAIGKYWYADTFFAKAKSLNLGGKPDLAVNQLSHAINLEPKQALFRSELANSLTNIALGFNQQKDKENSQKFINLALSESAKAVTLSPANVNLKRARFGVFIMLSTIDPKYLIDAQKTLIEAASQAPTDAKIFYNLGLTYARTGQPDKAIEILKKTIELKSNYKEARLAYAILLIDKGERTEAKKQLEYILTNIDPNDSLTKQTLESIK